MRTPTSATRWCDGCHEERPIEGMTFATGTFRNVYATCADCGDRALAAHEAQVEAAYRDAYGDMTPVEAWNADGNR